VERTTVRTAIVAGGGLLVAVVVAKAPSIYFAYRAPALRAALETALALIGTLVAFLCLGRYRRQRRAADLAIACALTMLALGYAVLAALPRAVARGSAIRLATWGPLCVRVLAAAVLAGGGFRLVANGLPIAWRRARRLAVAAGGAVVATVLLLVAFVPVGAASDLSAKLSERPDPLADPMVASIQLAICLLFAVAAARFAVAADEQGDRFLSWLAIGCALAGAASLDYALFPSLNPNSVLIGDVVWAVAVLAWAFGAVGEIVSYWTAVGQLARAEERRRLARDLHDGLAQELAFIVTHVQTPSAEQAPAEWLQQLRSSAERALAESRRAIDTLISDAPAPLQADLGKAVQDIAERTGARVDLEVEADIPVDQHETLVRIVREAVTNATRHGQASYISVTFADGDHPVLQVRDNGTGFDPAAIGRGGSGFGLVSMRERAEALGATLAVNSAPGKGTVVEVAWP
jgi:signal transduction histidine kinase